MRPLDWIIMFAPLLVVAIIGIYTRRYVKSVADFMAGGRNAGRYLLCTARSGMGGAVTFVAGYEAFPKAGFVLSWWGQMGVLVGLITGIYGFVSYRYRQTRALTLAQFFEMRYSRPFRLFCGILGYVAGLINYGIIPVVGAKFFVTFLQLPHTVQVFSYTVDTYLVLMALFLTTSTLLVTLGGQVTVLATDCAEGMFSLVAALVICIPLLLMFHWSQAQQVLLDRPPGHSLVNPFDAFQTQDFNFWYSLMGLVIGVYWTMGWQNAHAFNSCGLTPHESRMGGIIGRYRGFIGGAMGTLMAVCATTYLNHPAYATAAAPVHHAIAQLTDPIEQRKALYPLAISYMLPIGIRGLLCSTLLMGLISTDGMHLHSWSSILIQDVIMPLRKRPLTTRQHLTLLRLGMVFVALCAFTFGALFRQSEYVQIWFGVTQSIFCGGAGAAIIGGLYWRRGTTAAAWVGMLSGSILSFIGIIMQLKFWDDLHPANPTWALICHRLGPGLSIHGVHMNGTYVSLLAMIAAVLGYVVVSLLTCRVPHNMDRLLHRGQYAVASDQTQTTKTARRFDLSKIIGIDKEFTRGDRWLTIGQFWWSMAWFLLFVIGTAVELRHPFANGTWANFWLWTGIWLNLCIGVVTTIWFTIGCTYDMRVFFRRLRQEKEDVHDDGTVVHQDDRRGFEVVLAEDKAPVAK